MDGLKKLFYYTETERFHLTPVTSLSDTQKKSPQFTMLSFTVKKVFIYVSILDTYRMIDNDSAQLEANTTVM